MACKEWILQWKPKELYIMLCLSCAYFLVELVLSHTTHALTLLMDAYHMLCNIIALIAYIVMDKHGNINDQIGSTPDSLSEPYLDDLDVSSRNVVQYDLSELRRNRERKLKNTFGWTRIDVVFMLICFVFLASLSFSLIVEALQTLVHVDHHDEIHQPLFVLSLGLIGLLINGLCYLLIGGYTFHQGSFLYVTESGDVIFTRVIFGDSLKMSDRQLSRTRNIPSVPMNRERQDFREIIRDILGCIIVVITGFVVNFSNSGFAKFVDPILSILSAGILVYLSYPYMKESCLILLQTIPETINIDSLKLQLMEEFPEIINIHDLHIWQLTTYNIISTMHVVFENPKIYGKLMSELKNFFINNGISHVTIQPEFYKKSISLDSLISSKSSPFCLMSCQTEKCIDSHCCQIQEVITNCNISINSTKSTTGLHISIRASRSQQQLLMDMNSIWQSRDHIVTLSEVDLTSLKLNEAINPKVY